MKVETVDFVTIPTRDAERAAGWYREVLGLELGAAGEVEAPNLTFSFWNPEADGEPFQPNVAGVALRVADVKSACDELVAGGGELWVAASLQGSAFSSPPPAEAPSCWAESAHSL